MIGKDLIQALQLLIDGMSMSVMQTSQVADKPNDYIGMVSQFKNLASE